MLLTQTVPNGLNGMSRVTPAATMVIEPINGRKILLAIGFRQDIFCILILIWGQIDLGKMRQSI